MSWVWVKFQRPVIYSSTETWVQGWKVLWQLAVSLWYRTKEMFSVIDKACHSQTLNFKPRRRGYVGLAFELSELIRKTFLCCQTKSSQFEPPSHSWGGSVLYLVKCSGLLDSYLRLLLSLIHSLLLIYTADDNGPDICLWLLWSYCINWFLRTIYKFPFDLIFYIILRYSRYWVAPLHK